MDGDGPTVSGLYRILGVDWLLTEQEQFSSATTLRFLDGLPQDNTFWELEYPISHECPSESQGIDTTSSEGQISDRE